MLSFLLDVMSWLLLLSGSFFCLVGGIGFVRFPDIFTRLHASGLIETGGAFLILLGLILQAGLTIVMLKLFLLIVFLLLTSPSVTFAFTQAYLVNTEKEAILSLVEERIPEA